MDDLINQIVSDYSQRIKDYRIFFSANIPKKKLTNALNSYAAGVQEKDTLVLIDNTAFGSAKEGALLTSAGLYAHNTMEKPRHIDLKDIRNVHFKMGSMTSVLYVNGQKFLETNMPAKEAMQGFTEMLGEIAKHLHSKEDNHSTGQKLPSGELINDKEKITEKYSLQLTGDLLENKSLSDVKNQIAILFRLNQDRVDKLFERTPVVVKRDLDLETAHKYKNVFEKAGADCRIVPEKYTKTAAASLSNSDSNSSNMIRAHKISRNLPDQGSAERAASTIPAGRETEKKIGTKTIKPILPVHKRYNLSAQAQAGMSNSSLTPKMISHALDKIHEQHFSNQVLKMHGLLPRALVERLRAICVFPKDENVIAAINKPGYSFVLVITPQGVYWNHAGTCYSINYLDYCRLNIAADDPPDISLGPDAGIHISQKEDFEVIRDILVAFQYFVKNGRDIPEDQLLYKPPRCPRCGSPQWMTTTKNSMNWKAAFGAAMLSGPVVGAIVGSAWGEINKVKLCLKCHHFEKLDEQQK